MYELNPAESGATTRRKRSWVKTGVVSALVFGLAMTTVTASAADGDPLSISYIKISKTAFLNNTYDGCVWLPVTFGVSGVGDLTELTVDGNIEPGRDGLPLGWSYSTYDDGYPFTVKDGKITDRFQWCEFGRFYFKFKNGSYDGYSESRYQSTGNGNTSGLVSSAVQSNSFVLKQQTRIPGFNITREGNRRTVKGRMQFWYNDILTNKWWPMPARTPVIIQMWNGNSWVQKTRAATVRGGTFTVSWTESRGRSYRALYRGNDTMWNSNSGTQFK